MVSGESRVAGGRRGVSFAQRGLSERGTWQGVSSHRFFGDRGALSFAAAMGGRAPSRTRRAQRRGEAASYLPPSASSSSPRSMVRRTFLAAANLTKLVKSSVSPS